LNDRICPDKGEGVKIDLNKAAHCFKHAADQGITVAQYNYGNCLKKGEGVRIDFTLAAHYFKHAADQGIVDAQFNYGVCLKKGEGVQIDCTIAAHYFKLAADQGIVDGQLNYGLRLQKSKHVSKEMKGHTPAQFLDGEPSAVVTHTQDQIRKDKHAVKMLQCTRMDSDFEREIEILNSLNHRLVIQSEGSVPPSDCQKGM
jgi:TPR repeat protein